MTVVCMAESRSQQADCLRYSFDNEALLCRALTHRSAAARHNERLEFLGDSILNFLIAEALYQRFVSLREGELTRLRATLVRRETLAAISRDLGIGALLSLGGGELKSGGRDRDSILADAFEALVGAVYLDSDLSTCRDWLLRVFDDRIHCVSAEAAHKDPKTRLQERMQAHKLPLPDYAVIEVAGAAHEHCFTVECRVSGLSQTTVGSGPNRRGAEQDAADKALALLEPC